MPESTGDLPLIAGRYQARHLLGEGPNARAYAAHDEVLARPVAVKMWKSALPSSARAALFDRLKRAARISHPSVRPAHALGQMGRRPYIVMPLIPDTLAARLRHGRLSVEDAVKTALDLARALSAMHAIGFVHGHLTPTNVMYDASRRAAVADFAHPVPLAAADSAGRARNLEYMSPEHAGGREPDARSDVFSLGAILYLMLVGRPPFEAGRLPPVSVYRPGLDPRLDAIALKALAQVPGDRFSTADEFAAALAVLDTSDAADLGTPPLPTGDPSSATPNVADIGKQPPVTAEPASDEADIGAVCVPSDDPPSSFEMGRSVPELPPVRLPSEPSFRLPPVGLPGSDPSFGSVGSVGSLPSLPSLTPTGSGAPSVPDISILFPDQPKAEVPPTGPFVSPDNALGELDLPPVPPGATASSVNLGSCKPVAPSDSWLESGAYDLKRTDPDVDLAAPGPESFDIFSGRAAPTGDEYSDVIAATAGPPPRPSDVAINFAGPPGGTIEDFDAGDPPKAAEGSSAVLDRRADDESIHDVTAADKDPLFDSATLADAPDLPPGRPADATDFGGVPVYTPDASSILGGTEADIDLDGGSAVSIERPSVAGTLGSPADGAFDLTVPDGPIPAGLFDDEPAVPPSGSDLFDVRTAAELDFEDGRVEPVDGALVSDRPALTSAPSSIFSGDTPPQPTDPDIEEAEFHPRSADVRRTSSGDFELPDVADLIAAKAPTNDGDIDWDAVSENEDATRGIPRDASLSALIRERMEEASENPMRDETPVSGTASGPEVTIDWATESSEQAALETPTVAPPKKSAKKPKPTRKPAAEPKPEPDLCERPTKPTADAKAEKKAPTGGTAAVLRGAKKRKSRKVAEGGPEELAALPITDRVCFSVTAPAVLRAGGRYALDVWAHLAAQRAEMLARAKEAHPLGPIRVHTKTGVRIARGTALTVRVVVPTLAFDPGDDADTLEWAGEVDNATFAVRVPAGAAHGSHAGTARIHVAGLEIAKLHFELEVGSAAGPQQTLTVRESRHKTAFASYASQDRDAVLARIQGIQKALPDLDIFVDVASLRSGDRWADVLELELARRDVFYLFWSANARASEWVEREWRAALKVRGIDYIDPVPLADPKAVPPPAELAGALHFNDWVLAYMRTPAAAPPRRFRWAAALVVVTSVVALTVLLALLASRDAK